MNILALLAAVSLAPFAHGAVIAGRDCNNGRLVCDGATPVCGSAELCGNGDELQGTFTRVNLFSVPATTTVFVYPATPLVVYATTVAITGTISGIGRGFFGGGGGGENSSGLDGSGTGRGRGAVVGRGGAGGG
ncbi:MAG: hypothetical protein HY553_03150, partial [Elusimicrobia bacterium]|nr:hypothetical protein [Elusimicrobiota bacterium]